MLRPSVLLAVLTMALFPGSAPAQERPDREREPGQQAPPPGERPRGMRGGPGGMGGPGGPMRGEIELLESHDANGDGWLNAEERAAARATLAERRAGQEDRRGRRGRRGPRGGEGVTTSPGPAVAVDEVPHFTDAPLYDVDTLRTIFLTFENQAWEEELEAFHGSDVDVPATMIVDGIEYPGVGVHFRGASSYMMVPRGAKRSLTVDVDFIDDKQRLYGYKTLNLINCAGDASMMSAVLYAQLADANLAIPKANFVQVVINGEYWGVYVNVQQFDKVFTKENFGSSKGTRWKVPGSPRGDGGLTYEGEDLAPYEARYDMKSNDGEKAWEALIELCRVLDETPLDQLVEKLSPILDIDETLWFLAYEVVFMNSDGYWTRASDYSLFRDRDGQFHVIPHDTNEAFRAGRRRGGPRRDAPGGGGATLDPLVSLDNDRMPLRSRLLAVPELRERYLEHVQQIAEHDLDWAQLGPRVARFRQLIEEAVRKDTRKVTLTAAFLGATADDGALRRFADARRAFLVDGIVSEEEE